MLQFYSHNAHNVIFLQRDCENVDLQCKNNKKLCSQVRKLSSYRAHLPKVKCPFSFFSLCRFKLRAINTMNDVWRIFKSFGGGEHFQWRTIQTVSVPHTAHQSYGLLSRFLCFGSWQDHLLLYVYALKKIAVWRSYLTSPFVLYRRNNVIWVWIEVSMWINDDQILWELSL